MFHVKHEDLFELYFQRLIEYNENVNLTSIVDKNEVFIKHFQDSLEFARALPDIGEKNYKIIDVGTGAGFPGLPLAICYPNIEVTLTDALDKRLNFLRDLSSEMGLKNVHIVHARAEDLGRDPDFRERYDISTARAVSNLSTIVEYCTPLIHKNGLFIPLKSADVISEIDSAKNAISVLGCKIKDLITYDLPEGMGSRSLVVIEKISTTPQKYPRKAGTPSKKPL